MTPTEAARHLREWFDTWSGCDRPDECAICVPAAEAARMGAEALEREAAADDAEPLDVQVVELPGRARAGIVLGDMLHILAAPLSGRSEDARAELAARLRATARKLEST